MIKKPGFITVKLITACIAFLMITSCLLLKSGYVIGAGYTLSGYIKPDLSVSTSSQLEGFKVSVAGAPQIYTFTDSNGYFELALGSQNQNVTVEISKGSYLQQNIPLGNFTTDLILGSKENPALMWSGDLVQDNAINMRDIIKMADSFNSTAGDSRYNQYADVNMDKAVNMIDITIVARHFNKSSLDYGIAALAPVQTPSPTATVTNTPTPTKTPQPSATGRQMESLTRGVTAVKVSNGVYISWRLFGTDPSAISFNVYRDGIKITSSPVTAGTNYLDSSGSATSKYYVCPVLEGVEQSPSETANALDKNYLSIPLQIPAGGTTPDGVAYTYNANDCSVGDLDGDHEYEIVLKWDPSNAKDNSQAGYTGNQYIDAYKLNGTRLWRIDLGKNIRAGAHYTQFMVYDLDGDGKAELACKTADGTIDGKGKVIGSASADNRNSDGYILTGSEYLTIFEGTTGKALTTINYEPARGTVSSWGDKYGNRCDRYLACVAYLDGVRPSLVMCRGYYTRAVLVAYNWRDGKLTRVWTFDSNAAGNSAYAGQGNHNLSVADVDSDGKDEIVYGACCIDDNGEGLYSTGLNHGDAMHVSDMDPSRPGLELWQCHETASATAGSEYRDVKTGRLIWGRSTTDDNGRALAADIDSRYNGFEMWAAATDGVYNVNGIRIATTKPSTNFAIWWDGDLLRELLDGNKIDKWNNGSTTRLLTVNDCSSNNSTKSTPCLSADILGDWREELVLRTSDNKALRIYITTAVTDKRIYTLMHDPQYRLSIAWQNVAYNQPPHTGFFLGYGMTQPPVPKIYLAP